MSGGGGRGIMRILQSLMGGSGEFYSDTTKILPSPSPLPQAIKKKEPVLHPLPPMSDQEIISPYKFNTISSIEVMRVK